MYELAEFFFCVVLVLVLVEHPFQATVLVVFLFVIVFGVILATAGATVRRSL